MLPIRCQVLVVGAGPCGLMLANELGRRGIATVVLDQKSGTAFNPQANATQARTMELFRRLGIAEEIRSQGLPPDHPTDIAYYTRLAGYELARLRLPSAREAREQIRTLSGSWGAAELPHRIAQKYVEATLLRHAQRLSNISVHFGWRLTGFTESSTGVEAQALRLGDGTTQAISADFLIGADGARSFVREQLGFEYVGETGVQRDFMGGRMYAIYVRVPGYRSRLPHPLAWMNVTVNRDRRALVIAVDGNGEFAFHTQLRPGESEAAITPADARAMVAAAFGTNIDTEILSTGSWTAGHALVANGYQRGRVFLGGDAAHLFTPTGGLGYNTAVEDAVNLGWKVSAVLKGLAPAALLDSYGAERRPLAVRNTAYARAFAESLGRFEADAALEEDTDAGAQARQRAGAYLEAHARAEFNIPGITFGGRYDHSPVIVKDGSQAPPDSANVYVPTASPGGRAPHQWLPDGQSLFDRFGFEWTLLNFSGKPAASFEAAARDLAVDLRIVDLPDTSLRDLYEADLALIRPDQIVAWRGTGQGHEPRAILGAVLGRTIAE